VPEDPEELITVVETLVGRPGATAR